MLRKVLFFLLLSNAAMAQNFIQVKGKHFEKNGAPYYFLGTNFWYGMNLASKGPGGDRQRLLRELDQLQALGINNLRIIAASEGPDTEPWRVVPSLMPEPGVYNQDLLDGLDFLLAEMGKRNIHAVVCLNNYWAWSGGMAQYVNWFTDKSIPYPNLATGGGWTIYSFYTSKFYKVKAAKALYQSHIKMLINRVNSYTGKAYKDDPTIMSWQLCNEPRAMLRPRKYRKWIQQTAALIKSLDPNHLVSIGSEGKTPYPVNNRFEKDHADKNIDYFTFHLWIQNWQWYEPESPAKTYPAALQKAKKYFDYHVDIAAQMEKPIVLEEFGIARDLDSHDPAAATVWRDRYYRMIFDLIYARAQAGTVVAGCNFWAWGGEGRPSSPKAIWKAGDDFIGDPPHEYQGWYSVYEKDASTLELIKIYTEKFNQLK